MNLVMKLGVTTWMNIGAKTRVKIEALNRGVNGGVNSLVNRGVRVTSGTWRY